MFVYSSEVFHEAKRLLAAGHSNRDVAMEVGVSRSTVQHWRSRTEPPRGWIAPDRPPWRPPDERTYAYVLGLYLGDGCLTVHTRHSASLVITLDLHYVAVVAEAMRAMQVTWPGRHVGLRTVKDTWATVLQIQHPALPEAFPQHGPGKKHQRRIELTGWQRELTHAHPRAFIRGLIHSDGSRCINRFKTKLPSGRVAEYEYPRYFFTNYSGDIRRIFCEHCDLLGLRWTQSSFKNISVSHRKSVALLDQFVGPKR